MIFQRPGCFNPIEIQPVQLRYTFASMSPLQTEIERLASSGSIEDDAGARSTFLEFRDALTQGEIRAAEKIGGQWVVNVWVKQGILLGFRLGQLASMSRGECLSFVDKDTFPARRFTVEDRVRVVPGARRCG